MKTKLMQVSKAIKFTAAHSLSECKAIMSYRWHAVRGGAARAKQPWIAWLWWAFSWVQAIDLFLQCWGKWWHHHLANQSDWQGA